MNPRLSTGIAIVMVLVAAGVVFYLAFPTFKEAVTPLPRAHEDTPPRQATLTTLTPTGADTLGAASVAGGGLDFSNFLDTSETQ